MSETPFSRMLQASNWKDIKFIYHLPFLCRPSVVINFSESELREELHKELSALFLRLEKHLFERLLRRLKRLEKRII